MNRRRKGAFHSSVGSDIIAYSALRSYPPLQASPERSVEHSLPTVPAEPPYTSSPVFASLFPLPSSSAEDLVSSPLPPPSVKSDHTRTSTPPCTPIPSPAALISWHHFQTPSPPPKDIPSHHPGTPAPSLPESIASNPPRFPAQQPSDTAILRSLSASPELQSPFNHRPKTRYEASYVNHEPPPPNPPSPESAWGIPVPIREGPTHHFRYYLEDGVVFLAQNTLFKVPRYMLNQESETFRQLYSDQFEPGGKGSTDHDPIILDGVEVGDFEQLLNILYPRSILAEIWTEMEWQSVLHLSVMWKMPEVRFFAIEKLNSHASPINKLLLGRRYDISPWIRAGLLALCLREESLTDNEGSQLEWKDILKISRAREMIRLKVMSTNRRKDWAYTKYGQTHVYKTEYNPALYTQNFMVHHILDEIFQLEDWESGPARAPPSIAPSSNSNHSPAPSLAELVR